MMRSLMIPMLGSVMLGGCTSALKLENVTGSWSCPRVDGVCAEISDIDTGLVANSVDGVETAFSIGNTSGVGVLPSAAPIRTGDEVAKIVLAPMIDANGYYLGPREIYAVMRSGSWARPLATTDKLREGSPHRVAGSEDRDER